jgi:hypothetical protein
MDDRPESMEMGDRPELMETGDRTELGGKPGPGGKQEPMDDMPEPTDDRQEPGGKPVLAGAAQGPRALWPGPMPSQK